MSATTQGSVLVDLVDVVTGETVTRPAVDARELLASGSYVVATDAPVAAPSVGGEGEGGAPSTAESTTSESEGASESSSESGSESEVKPTRRKAQG